MHAVPAPALLIGLRLIGAAAGGYACTFAMVALLAAVLQLGGMPRSEAAAIGAMLGCVLYPLLLLWAFSVRRVAWLWAVLAAATALAGGLILLLR